MSTLSRHRHRTTTLTRPGRVVVPDRPETWTAEEVEMLLWPDAPDHLPQRNREEGWPELLHA
jgi:hypothetical protein